MKHDCKDCRGTGKATYRHPTRAAIVSHECTSCNGTGIAGDPRGAFAAMLLSALFLVALVAWLV